MHHLCLAKCQLAFFSRQMKNMSIPPTQQLKIMNTLIDQSASFEVTIHPGIAGSRLFQTFCEALGNNDPLKDIRTLQNKQALALYAQGIDLIQQASDPLLTALKLSASGNIMDAAFGDSFDIEQAMEACVHQPFALNHYPLLIAHLLKAKTLTLITDNAGEIVFDRLLCETLQQWRKTHALLPLQISVMVKAGPIYNDALESDALSIHLDSIAKIINTGSNFIGIHTKYMSKKALLHLSHSDLIISKGLANHESDLGEETFIPRIFDLFRMKCAWLSHEMTIPQNSMVLMHHH